MVSIGADYGLEAETGLIIKKTIFGIQARLIKMRKKFETSNFFIFSSKIIIIKLKKYDEFIYMHLHLEEN